MSKPSRLDLSSPRLLRGVLLFIAVGVAFYLAGMIWSGWTQVVTSWQHLGPGLIAVGALTASCAYLLRFARWQYCLHVLGHRVALGRSLGVYLAGLALTTSPGKMGETVRSLLLLPDGVPARHSLGSFLADRLSDVVGVCLMAVVGSLLQGKVAWPAGCALLGVILGALVLRGVLTSAVACPIWAWLALRMPQLPWGRLRELLETWARLWSVPRMLAFALLAATAYSMQACVMVLLCHKVGLALSLAQGIEIFANATLFGAASMVPGGLGAMEAALVWQLGNLGVAQTMAVAVAIATRLVTLWLGILLGVVALILVARKAAAPAPALAESA